MNKSFWWLIVILAIVAVGGIYLKNNKSGTAPDEEVAVEEELVPATGNVNDAVDAILDELTSEELTPDEADSAVVEADDTLLNGFDEVFDANQL